MGFKEVMFGRCRHCGFKVSGGFTTCGHCGRKFVEDSRASSSGALKPSNPPKPPKPSILEDLETELKKKAETELEKQRRIKTELDAKDLEKENRTRIKTNEVEEARWKKENPPIFLFYGLASFLFGYAISFIGLQVISLVSVKHLSFDIVVIIIPIFGGVALSNFIGEGKHKD